MTSRVIQGDCVEVMRGLPECSVDAVVTDPPYELGFMGKAWDGAGVAYSVTMWSEVLRVLKPGGHLLAFGGTRTYHRMACAIEDAGFEIRDSIHWVYGSGFPKSLNIGKQDGCEAWEGWGTALKPAHEPVVVARKPLVGTVAGNVLVYGTGGLNIDGCRVPGQVPQVTQGMSGNNGTWEGPRSEPSLSQPHVAGRWPANVVFDRAAGEALDQQSGETGTSKRSVGKVTGTTFGSNTPMPDDLTGVLSYGDKGGASRFFTQADFGPDDWPFVYQAKPSRRERNAGLDGLPKRSAAERYETLHTLNAKNQQRLPASNHHPTVKPVALMRHLVRLVTPPGGVVLDPFAGSGTTLVAATLEGFDSIGIEMTYEYLPIIEGRTAWAAEQTFIRSELDKIEADSRQPTLLDE